jgi:hypothetical protein
MDPFFTLRYVLYFSFKTLKFFKIQDMVTCDLMDVCMHFLVFLIRNVLLIGGVDVAR